MFQCWERIVDRVPKCICFHVYLCKMYWKKYYTCMTGYRFENHDEKRNVIVIDG